MLEDLAYLNFLKSLGLVASIVGFVIGLDLILGAKIVTILKAALEKSFDIEKKISSPLTKIRLGIVFMILSVVIVLLLKAMK